jgi:hypothetical protein
VVIVKRVNPDSLYYLGSFFCLCFMSCASIGTRGNNFAFWTSIAKKLGNLRGGSMVATISWYGRGDT